jgi:D-amino-acid oxidase
MDFDCRKFSVSRRSRLVLAARGISMKQRVAVIGAGVSGLTSAVLLAEHGYDVSIFTEETGQRTTSAAAAAIWFPYDAEPADKVIPWALETYQVLVGLSREPRSGVSMIELRQFSRAGKIEIPGWAHSLGARNLRHDEIASVFNSGFALTVPLMNTTIYLDYLWGRLTNSGGAIHDGVRFEKVEDVDPKFDLVINCAGFGAKALVHDADLEPHRGQVAIVPKIEGLTCAMVCDDAPLMYAIPRARDCVFGGTNDRSQKLAVDPKSTARIMAECSRVLKIDNPPVLADRVGIRPFRKSGVRVEHECLRDGRMVIHNYGHGGAGFTLSWGCAREIVSLAQAAKT